MLLMGEITGLLHLQQQEYWQSIYADLPEQMSKITLLLLSITLLVFIYIYAFFCDT